MESRHLVARCASMAFAPARADSSTSITGVPDTSGHGRGATASALRRGSSVVPAGPDGRGRRAGHRPLQESTAPRAQRKFCIVASAIWNGPGTMPLHAARPAFSSRSRFCMGRGSDCARFDKGTRGSGALRPLHSAPSCQNGRAQPGRMRLGEPV